jgi:hypothetical protein
MREIEELGILAAADDDLNMAVQCDCPCMPCPDDCPD